MSCRFKIIQKESIQIESSIEHPIVNEFVIINIPEEDVKPQLNLPLQEIIILDPDDQPMWENAKIVASTPNSALVQPNVDDNFVINSTHLNMIRKNNFDLCISQHFPNVRQLNELLVKYLQTEFLKILSAHDFSNSLPTKLEKLSSKFNELTKEVKGLKKQVHELEIKLPGDLKEIPTKLEDFTKTVTSLTSQVAELKTLQWELPVEFLSVPTQIKTAIASNKTKDAIVPLAGSSQPEGEHIKKDKGKKAISLEEAEKESTNSGSDDDETHFTGSMVESFRINKVKKFDFVTEGGKHIHLTEEEINQQKKIEEDAKAKAAKRESEVRKEEMVNLLGPEEIQKKMDYIHATEAELGNELDIPLSEHDPLNKLNDLANKKRKHVDDIYDYFRASKRLKSSVQNEDHPTSIVLNEPVLEIFFRRHQGPGLNDHARTFSSLLLAEIDKRNLNPLKQMRTIEQLRQ
ncbi:hypothetical protein Tco_0951750 [Tanacetum coccineum]|uniref:Uncharacterized protein n=1 Tax=Tanacetum coccineum TaxID=301880 RepID=A0ABQ5DV25_9ASTR